MGNGFNIPNFSGGINESIDKSLIKSDEAYQAQNCNISEGNLSVCSGFSDYSSAAPGVVKSLMAFYKDNKGYLLLACGEANTIYKYDNGNFAFIDSGYMSPNFDFVNFKVDKDVIIFCNGLNRTQVYDGDKVRFLLNRRKVYNKDGSLSGYVDGNGAFHNSESDISTWGIIGKYMELHYERLWIAGNPNNPNTVYFSTADQKGFDPDDFTAPTSEEEANQHGGEIDVYTNDGGIIIGLKVVFDDVLIFKTKNIFKIFGSYPGNYTKIQIFSSNGAIADRSIVTTNKGAFFINKEAIWLYDGTNVTPVSQKIKKTFASLNKDYINNAVAVYYKNKYILAVPEGSSTTNNLIIEFDIENKNFMLKRGFEVTSFLEFEDKLLFTDGRSNKVFVYDSSESFGGNKITSFWEMGPSDLGCPDTIKEIDSIYFTGKGPGQIKIICNTDKKTKEKVIQLLDKEKVYRVSLRNKGRILSYRFENIDGCKFTIKGVKVNMELDQD